MSIDFKKFREEFSFGDRTIAIETGKIGRQSNTVVVESGNDLVLVAVVGKEEGAEANSFFPLTVNLTMKSYAAGKIPGSYFKREGRPTEYETLNSRLIDRPLRPLFPEGFMNEVQVTATIMSIETDPAKRIEPSILALIGSSAAIAISGMPFLGPVAAAQVGYKDGNYILNPTVEQLASSDLELVVAGTENAVLMVESEANQLSEDVMLGAVMFGHKQMQPAIQAINRLKAAAGKATWDWQPAEVNTALQQVVKNIAYEKIKAAYENPDKLARKLALDNVRNAIIEQLTADDANNADDVKQAFALIEKETVRSSVLSGRPRIDGRDTQTVRPIDIEVGLLPRVHGSALFTRGETQAIVVATLGTENDAQNYDDLDGERLKDRFMLHYNFPPYCVGETGFASGPKRREIGHGNLAKRAIKAVIPSEETFPYVLRIVSEITESNGSSSMATVCGTSLSLMDAGVPLSAPVAGIAMGLVKGDDNYVVLSDILGDEDHLGDMDFKVAGTSEGITALQMDIKIDGITEEIMQKALAQAKQGRMHILGEMAKVLQAPREKVSSHAPAIHTMSINPDKIREVIGKGGATIRAITEETGVTINIEDDGTVQIAGENGNAVDAAIKRIEAIVVEPEVGKIYEGKVAKLMEFGAFVNFMPGRDGFLHISQITGERIENISDELHEGQLVSVKVIELDKQGRARLTMLAEG